MKVAEMVTVRKNSAVLTVPIVFRGLRALDEQVGGDDRAPAAAAGGVEEAAGEAERSDDLGLALGVAVHHAAIEEIEAERGEIGEDDRLGGRRRSMLRQHIGAEHAADHAGDDDPEEQPPVDVLVGDMADARDGGGEGLGRMDPGRGRRRRHADADQQGRWRSAPKAMPSAPSIS